MKELSIEEKAKTEKQRVLLTETDGTANIDWDCRSLDDVKVLLKCGLEFIRTIEANKQIQTDSRIGGCSLRVPSRYDKDIKQGEQKPDDVDYNPFDDFRKSDSEINPSEFDARLNALLKEFESLPKEELVNSLAFYLNVVQNDGTYKSDEKQGEQKSVTEKPVFEIGEKITDGTSTFTIVSIKDEHYIADDGDKVCFYVAHKYYTLFKEQKPAEWSEEDAEMINYIASILYSNFNENEKFDNNKPCVGALVDWLKSLKDRVQPKQEWSEEDISKIDRLIMYFKGKGNKEYTEWFSLLKDRVLPQPRQEWSEEDKTNIDSLLDVLYRIKKGKDPQATTRLIEQHINFIESLKERYTWKPSYEQLVALDGICSYIRNKADWEISQDTVSDLYKLSEQLKKLREEDV